MMSSANMITIVVVAVYMIGMLVIGKIAEKKTKGSADDYLVAGRNMPLWMVTATLFATWWGGETVMGASGAALEGGIMDTLYDPWGCGAALIVAGLFYMKVCRDMKLRSMGSFYIHRFGHTTGLISSYALIPGYVLWLAVQILAIGKVFQVVLGLPIIVTTIIGAAVIIFYTYSGGILAVAWTDFVQMLLILIGLFFLMPISISKAGGWDVIRSYEPEGFWQIIPSMGDWETWLWWIAVMISMTFGNIPGPDLMQRSFIAKDSETAKKCGVIAGGMYWIFGLLPVAAALCFNALVGEGVISAADAAMVAEDSELVIPMLARAVMNPFFAAIFTAALLAAIMSSADSSLFATASIMANDLYPYYYKKKHNQQAEDSKIYTASRLAVLFTGIAAVIITFFANSLYQLLIFSIVYIWHMLFFPFTLGIYWKKCNSYGATAGMVVGLILLLVGCFTQGTAEPEPEWFWTLFPAVFSGLAVVVVSLLTQKINPPLPLTSEDNEIVKWPELAVNLPASFLKKEA